MPTPQAALAGSLESSDLQVYLEPRSAGGIVIELDSPVRMQFGAEIVATADRLLRQAGVVDALLQIRDRGAIDPVIRARLRTVISRAYGADKSPWEVAP